jgi:hypothetical protein
MDIKKQKKSIEIPVKIWLGDNGQIRIRFLGTSGRLGIVTVANSESKRRGHPKLYECLQCFLQREGKWPSEN